MLSFVFCGTLFSQEKIDMIELLNAKDHVEKLEKRISKMIKKHSSLSKVNDIKQYHIFELEFNEPHEENFLLYKSDIKESLKKMSCSSVYVYRKFNLFRKKIILARSLLVDPKGCLVGIADRWGVYSVCNNSIYKEEQKIADMFYENRIDFAFRALFHTKGLGYDTLSYNFNFIAIKDENVYYCDYDTFEIQLVNKGLTDEQCERY